MEIKYGGISYEIKDDVNDFNIGEYEVINFMLIQEQDFFDKWFKVLEYLGLPNFVIDDIDGNDLINIIKAINLSECEVTYITEIEIDGYLYKVDMKDGNPRITGKTFKMLEKVCKKDYYISDILAILFKRVDLTDTEHYDMTHIEHKANLFKKQNASMSLPYINLIAEKYIKNIHQINGVN